MSKWRYEVEKKNCGYFDRPKYIVYSNESVRGYIMGICGNDMDYLENSCEFWGRYTSNKPSLAIYKGVYSQVKGTTFGNKKREVDGVIEEMFPAKRIGRMFPRHKQQIAYK